MCPLIDKSIYRRQNPTIHLVYPVKIIAVLMKFSEDFAMESQFVIMEYFILNKVRNGPSMNTS